MISEEQQKERERLYECLRYFISDFEKERITYHEKGEPTLKDFKVWLWKQEMRDCDY